MPCVILFSLGCFISPFEQPPGSDWVANVATQYAGSVSDARGVSDDRKVDGNGLLAVEMLRVWWWSFG